MLYFLLMLLLYILTPLMWLIIFRGRFSSFKEAAAVWGLYPILMTWIQTSINRNGDMTISGIENNDTLVKSIEAGAIKLEFLTVERTDTTINFDKRTKWKRFFNIFLRENLKLTIENDRVLVYGKKNILPRFEFKIKRDFNIELNRMWPAIQAISGMNTQMEIFPRTKVLAQMFGGKCKTGIVYIIN